MLRLVLFVWQQNCLCNVHIYAGGELNTDELILDKLQSFSFFSLANVNIRYENKSCESSEVNWVCAFYWQCITNQIESNKTGNVCCSLIFLPFLCVVKLNDGSKCETILDKEKEKSLSKWLICGWAKSNESFFLHVKNAIFFFFRSKCDCNFLKLAFSTQFARYIKEEVISPSLRSHNAQTADGMSKTFWLNYIHLVVIVVVITPLFT